MTANLFDVNYYRQTNPDLATKGIITDQQLTDHFFTYGLDDNRTFSRFVDLDYYRASNPDLPANGVNTNRALYFHLDNEGLKQGRRFSRYTDINFYKQANQDLAAFNNEQLFDHLQASALNEGRRFSPFFDLGFYRQANPNLAPLNFTQTELFDHLRSFGLDDPGRPISQFLNLNFYSATYKDLGIAGLVTPRQLFNHFQDSGVFENRRPSPFSDIDFYRYANPDLAAGLVNTDLFGNINLETYRNLQTAGLFQGRRLSPFIDINIYRQSNADLLAANLSNYNLLNHLEINGLKEERRISNSFDPTIYRANNTDLAGLGGRVYWIISLFTALMKGAGKFFGYIQPEFLPY
ncbi:MAG: hypothetical protein N5P05_000473 [Chroococcopsis gigantea SAG 12.99]|nr:hypothetical protein [Chroococcopsis gigantea SAG 12.99]